MAQIHLSHIVRANKVELFNYLCDINNLACLLKDHIYIEFIDGAREFSEGSEYTFNMVRFGLSQDVRFRVEEVKKERYILYSQIEGLFKSWTHKQVFEGVGYNQTRVTDIISYEVPMGLLGHIANDFFIKEDMSKILLNRLKQAEKHLEMIESA